MKSLIRYWLSQPNCESVTVTYTDSANGDDKFYRTLFDIRDVSMNLWGQVKIIEARPKLTQLIRLKTGDRVWTKEGEYNVRRNPLSVKENSIMYESDEGKIAYFNRHEVLLINQRQKSGVTNEG